MKDVSPWALIIPFILVGTLFCHVYYVGMYGKYFCWYGVKSRNNVPVLRPGALMDWHIDNPNVEPHMNKLQCFDSAAHREHNRGNPNWKDYLTNTEKLKLARGGRIKR